MLSGSLSNQTRCLCTCKICLSYTELRRFRNNAKTIKIFYIFQQIIKYSKMSSSTIETRYVLFFRAWRVKYIFLMDLHCCTGGWSSENLTTLFLLGRKPLQRLLAFMWVFWIWTRERDELNASIIKREAMVHRVWLDIRYRMHTIVHSIYL